jgi:hypothetical protein
MVFGPASVLFMGSEKNCVGQVRGFANGSRTGHRTVTNQKSENFIDAALAFGQGARKAKGRSLRRMRPVGVRHWRSKAGRAPKSEPKNARIREVAAAWVVPDGGASLQSQSEWRMRHEGSDRVCAA